jgi:hypothetical protein
VMLMAFYLHLGPYARKVIATIDTRLGEGDDTAAGKGIGQGDAPATQRRVDAGLIA